jgi:predicted DNA binding CopG/RHH family protein
MWVTQMKLDSEEKEILQAFDKGLLKRLSSRSGALIQHRKVAEATFKKDSRINIRLSSKDLRALQKRALSEGIPYQTLVSSVLHKFAEGQLAERVTSPPQPASLPPRQRRQGRRLSSGG